MMRGLISGFLMLLAAGASAEETPETGLVGNGKPSSLADNAFYVSDGAVTNFETCLAVANDHRALQLWGNDDENEASEDVEPEIKALKYAGSDNLSARLSGLSQQVKLRLGFGTLYTCAQIADAWSAQGAAAGRDQRMSLSQDGRRRHGTVVIDLAMGESHYRNTRENDDIDDAIVEERGTLRGSIEAIPLVRILTSPRLLPPRDFGGVVIRNAEIDGALLFYNVDLDLPLAFANVRFRGHNFEQNVFGDERDLPMLDTAIAIINARFNDSVHIAASEICGSIRATDSRFVETVSFRRTQQYGIGCDPATAKAAAPEFTVNTSIFEQQLLIDRTDLGSLRVAGSHVESIVSTHSRFGATLNVVENEIGSMQILCSVLAVKAEIARNQVAGQVLVEGIDKVRDSKGEEIDTACHDWWQKSGWLRPEARTQLMIDDNQIGGRINLSYFAGPVVEPPLLLTNNRVSGRSLVVMPGPKADGNLWKGSVSFNGSTYEGLLEIRHSASKATRQRASVVQSGYCDETPIVGKTDSIAIFLNVTHVRRLLWNLPLTCDYRWFGYGMTYDHWIKGGFAKASLPTDVPANQTNEDHLALKNWRKTLKRHDPSPLIGMSQYLADKGQYVESRRILYEAKRLNYAPNCKPDDLVGACLVQMVDGLFNNEAEAAEAIDQADSGKSMPASDDQSWNAFKTRFWNAAEWLWRFSMIILLWPGGYGASPEWAIVLLVSLFGACWFAYALYARAMRGRLLAEWDSIEQFVDDQERRRSGSTDPQKAAPTTGPKDEAVTFEHHPASSEQTGQDRPGEGASTEQLTFEEKLRAVQGPLLAKIKDWEQMTPASDENRQKLVDYRHRLERFGDTDVAGFGRFDLNKMPTRFSARLYAFDTMLPVIDLHAYSSYYPISTSIRALSIAQHVCGWWWVTVFIASAAIL